MTRQSPVRRRGGLGSLPAAILVLLLVPPGAAGQSTAQAIKEIRWFGSFEEAAMDASAKSRPLLVHFCKDDDLESLAIQRTCFSDSEVRGKMDRFTCVLANPAKHPMDQKTRTCERFGSIACDLHVRAFTAASERVNLSTLTSVPLFVFLRPDRTPILRKPGAIGKHELLATLDQALDWWEHPNAARDLSTEAFEKLCAEANAPFDKTRKHAIKELARHDDPRVLAFLAAQLKPEAGEVHRQEAIKAIKDVRNVNTLTLAIPLLYEASGQLRRNAVFTLRNLALPEAVPPMMTSYERETTDRMRALILRTVVRMDRKQPKMLQVHRDLLFHGNPMMRVHAVRASLDLDVRGPEFDQVLELAHKATSQTVQAVACYVATELLLRADAPADRIEETPGAGNDGYVRTRERPHVREIKALAPKLSSVLADVAEGARTDEMRAYATECVKALDGKPSSFREGVRKFHDDAKDEIFKEY